MTIQEKVMKRRKHLAVSIRTIATGRVITSYPATEESRDDLIERTAKSSLYEVVS